MLILFDHGTPQDLARALPGHTITTAQARRWVKLNNGALLNAAEEAGLDLQARAIVGRHDQHAASGGHGSCPSQQTCDPICDRPLLEERDRA
jgi:hypothetical protein